MVIIKIRSFILKVFKSRAKVTTQQLLAYAQDKTADLGSRDDAVLYLSDYDLPEVEAALISMVQDHSEEETIVDQAGHALWIIWQRQKRTPPAELLVKMQPSARKFFENGL